MSVSTLNRTFKEATGFSPVEYHLKIRIKRQGNFYAIRTTVLPKLPVKQDLTTVTIFPDSLKRLQGFHLWSLERGVYRDGFKI